MPQSMDMKAIRQMVKDGGYGQLIWALTLFLEQGQYQLAAMIVIALCLAPRNTSLADNGVLSVLRSHKIQRWMWENGEFTTILNSLVRNNDHADKIGATLVGSGWWENIEFHPRNTDPRLWNDDDVMFFTEASTGFNYGLCDHAGTQVHRYFQHFRLIRDFEHDDVRVISKQMDRDSKTFAKSTRRTEEYYEFRVPAYTVLHRMNRDLCGRTLNDVLEPGVWYNYHFQPDTALDLTDRGGRW